tara:strand:- start:4919 stop:5338 length:420 start_codon:yes stop_codon:yes gene_type:complete
MRCILIPLTLILLVQCSPQPEHVITDTWTDGKTKREVILLDGDSTVQTFYQNGALEKIRFYEAGKQSGDWNAYYDDGTLWSEHHYSEGVQVGAYRTWHPNGAPYIEGEYNALGKPSGTWVITDKEGNILRTVEADSMTP